MALKPDRDPNAVDISFFTNDTTAARGGIMTLSTAGSGSAMDQSEAVATYAANPSGKAPLGILVNEVVNDDLTRVKQNFHKDQVQTGGKVTLISRGWAVTDRIYPGTTPTAGARAYVSHSGYITPTSLGAEATPIVGRFLSTKNEDGFAKVAVNLPMAES